jgi:hypothetical protein
LQEGIYGFLMLLTSVSSVNLVLFSKRALFRCFLVIILFFSSFKMRAPLLLDDPCPRETAEWARRLLTGRWGWVLAFAVGMGPWLVTNGTFVEVSLIAPAVPEGDAISSLLATATQAGNVVPFFVVALRQRARPVALSSIIFAMGAGALLAAALLAGFWDAGSAEHSTGLLALALLGGFAGTCSKVVLFPYASKVAALLPCRSLFLSSTLTLPNAPTPPRILAAAQLRGHQRRLHRHGRLRPAPRPARARAELRARAR